MDVENLYLLRYGIVQRSHCIYFEQEAFLQFNAIKDKISEQDAIGLQEIINDLVYINEMRRLDDNFFTNLQKQPKVQSNSYTGPSDIVPITGLLVNRLHRLENELKTVHDHWYVARHAAICAGSTPRKGG